MMKAIAQKITNILILSVLMSMSGVSAQVARTESGDTSAYERPFDITMFMSPEWKLNLMLAIRRPGRVSITLRNANNTVLYRESLKKAPTRYWRKFNFEGSEPGVYRFEISDGREISVRQVEIVDIPTVDAQRYIVYGTQTGL